MVWFFWLLVIIGFITIVYQLYEGNGCGLAILAAFLLGGGIVGIINNKKEVKLVEVNQVQPAVKAEVVEKQEPKEEFVWTSIFNTWTIWWWFLTLAFVVGSFGLVYVQRGFLFLCAFFVYIGLISFFGDISIVETIRNNKLWVILTIIAFLFSGTIWFSTRWSYFTKKMYARYDTILQKWLKTKNLDALPMPTTLLSDEHYSQSIQIRSEWQKYFFDHNRDEYGLVEFRPSYADHKNEIITWFSAWPIDIPIWIVTEVMHDFWEIIYSRFKNILKIIMERNWRGTEHHMLTKEEKISLNNR